LGDQFQEAFIYPQGKLGGEAPDGKIPFPLMTKGEIFIRCKGGKCLEKEHKGMVPRGAMVTGGA
jgi:hypothetical protein